MKKIGAAFPVLKPTAIDLLKAETYNPAGGSQKGNPMHNNPSADPVKEPKPVPTFEIIVNSRPHVVSTEQVNFEQVVQLAFPGQQQEPNAVFSMTYRHAASKPHAGELGAGGTVEVKKGTVFNVSKTIKS
jgi:hypothetical protein